MELWYEADGVKSRPGNNHGGKGDGMLIEAYLGSIREVVKGLNVYL